MPIWKVTDHYKVKCGEKIRGRVNPQLQVYCDKRSFNRYVLRAVLPKYVHLECQLLSVYHLQSINLKYDKYDIALQWVSIISWFFHVKYLFGEQCHEFYRSSFLFKYWLHTLCGLLRRIFATLRFWETLQHFHDLLHACQSWFTVRVTPHMQHQVLTILSLKNVFSISDDKEHFFSKHFRIIGPLFVWL
jgi:hypothetical protein